ncbi:MAG: hypothetical protein ACE364_09370 [Chlorobiota bacterium]
MKHSTVYYGNSTIELHNTILGKETVIVNGVNVSEKYSLSGTNHRFTFTDEGKERHAQLTTKMNFNGVSFDLYIDNKPVITIPESNEMVTFFLIIIFAAVFLSIIF